MQEDRLQAFRADGHAEFAVVSFDERMLLEEPVESWPVCEAG